MPDSAVWMADASGEPIRIGKTRCGSGCSRRMTTGVLAGTSTRTPTNSIAITTGAYPVVVGLCPSVHKSTVEMVAEGRVNDRRAQLSTECGEGRQGVDRLLARLRIS